MKMSKYTPMIEQYLSIKAQAEDAFLFFRLGDFYELFFDDAVKAAQELEITLTGRDGGLDERIPMCGVPYHSAESYISRLVDKGYKVAICEQVEDPASAKGVVRREIVRIVTPGTVMEGKTLGEAQNNFIACVSRSRERYALAACDLSTGELFAAVAGDSLEQLIDEVNVYAPAELVGEPEILAEAGKLADRMPKTKLLTAWERRDEQALSRFPPEDSSRLPDECRRCIELLLAYLGDTQKRSLSHITRIRFYERLQYMTMDPMTRRNLELTETVLDRTKKGSLLWLLDRTVTAMGGRLLRRWIDQPLMSISEIERRLEAVDCLYNQLIVREEIRQQLKEVYDLQRLVGRIAYGSANGRDLVALKMSLKQVPELRRLCAGSGSASLKELAEAMDECEDLLGLIEAAIVDDPPVSVKEGGLIRQGYDERLDKLREASTNGKQWIADLERSEREATGIKSLKIGYNKVFGYYIEVTKSNLGLLPPDRYERKQTLANAERFVTPELKEKEALILEAEEKMADIEYALFVGVRDELANHISRLQNLAESIAAVDVLQSFAAVSAAYRYKRPQVHEGFELCIEDGRHPVVEAILKEGSFIANDTRMTSSDGRILLITGPNMAGKSTYMRQVAMICVMAQIGCFVPAERAVVPIIDRIFTRIGAADDLAGGQSTFMVEMMDIRTMTSRATARSLVIIDELGRGTSTGEGMAIAQAVIEYLHDRIGCKTLVSTHFHELARLEEMLGALNNHCMAVKESGQDVTFLRKLIRGAASTSYGIYCARIAGLPDSIISRAYELLNRFKAASKSHAALEAAAAAAEPSPGDPSVDLATAVKERDIERERFAMDGTGERPASLKESGAESSENSAEDHAAGSDAFDADIVQLSLFGEADARKKGGTAKSKADAGAEKVLQQLRNADLVNMTPMQAMNFLYELKQKLSK
jgi:DNA mismatch repair protein MutS